MNWQGTFRPQQRQRLEGWRGWLPLLLIPFAALAADAWLNVQVRLHDYDVAEMNRRLRELERELKDLEAEEAALDVKVRLDDRALELGLVEPGPAQIQVLYYAETLDGRPPVPRRLEIADTQPREAGRILESRSPTLTTNP